MRPPVTSPSDYLDAPRSPPPAPPSRASATASAPARPRPALHRPQIVFICPPVPTVAGGIKYLFRMAEALRRAGYDAVVSERTLMRPPWFVSHAPIVGRGVIGTRRDQVLVLPEDMPRTLQRAAARPQRKVMYCQSHVYSSITAPDGGGTYADFDISHILCSGRTVYDHCRHRHPSVPAHHIPCGIDPAIFHPRPKRECIAYIPRKRPVEAVYLRDLFRFTYPQFRDIEWVPIHAQTELETAATLGEATVFLSLNRIDGFGLTPVEAMASDCVVAGFTGIGGREYATLDNGYWANDDDFPACVRQLAEAVWLSRETGARRLAYAEACRRTTARYSLSVFENAITATWEEILNPHA